jgi:predicted 3-demethylubiquinone-9 3-methyltransferase (glyoxalase superfamily)
MAAKTGSKIFTHLWYAKEAEEAASFYATGTRSSREGASRRPAVGSSTSSGCDGRSSLRFSRR